MRGEGGVQVQDLAGPQPGLDAPGLQDQPQPRAHRRRVGDRVEPEHADDAGGGPAVALDHLDGAGLAGAVGPEQRQDRAGVQLERQAVDGPDGAVVDDEVDDGDGRRRRLPHRARVGSGPRFRRARARLTAVRGATAGRPRPSSAIRHSVGMQKVAETVDLPAVAAAGRTRRRVLRRLLEDDAATAREVAARLGLGAAAVRRHLDALVAEGHVVEVQARADGSRGRPARRFRLSDAGRALFGHAYDDVAVDALRELRDVGGDAAVSSWARRRLGELERRLEEAAASSSLAERSEALATALSAEGFVAEVVDGPGGRAVQVCQHHCPVQAVAAENPELCREETESLARVLGTHVQRLTTIASGHAWCTTNVPLTTVRTPQPQEGPA